MAFAFIQSDTASSATGFELSLAYSSNVTAGSLLIATFVYTEPPEEASLDDTQGNTWLPIGTRQQGGGGLTAWCLQNFYAVNAAAGATTVTATIPNVISEAMRLNILEYSGTNPQIDGTPVYNNHDSATPTSSAIVTTQDGDLLYLGGYTGFSYTSAGAGYTTRESTTAISIDDTDGGAAGSKTASYNCTANDNILGFVAFKEAAGEDTGLAWIRA